ncbi:hypothetical protein BDQ12DRAFT_525201 [Crucibulum laeve]|uniref:Uncharacterized protein n=1 Tax=Crucibulum laeve TaxID=68775 RepID=A0A5C3LTV1_9AGAR|nr:hypothetical protein BDQ12DRAFT_525201 [Crucibulum laeve]
MEFPVRNQTSIVTFTFQSSRVFMISVFQLIIPHLRPIYIFKTRYRHYYFRSPHRVTVRTYGAVLEQQGYRLNESAFFNISLTSRPFSTTSSTLTACSYFIHVTMPGVSNYLPATGSSSSHSLANPPGQPSFRSLNLQMLRTDATRFAIHHIIVRFLKLASPLCYP